MNTDIPTDVLSDKTSEIVLEKTIRAWLTNYVADLFGFSADQVRSSTTFEEYGFDSNAAVGLSGELSNWLGCSISAGIAYDHPTIDDLARALASDPEVQATFRHAPERKNTQ